MSAGPAPAIPPPPAPPAPDAGALRSLLSLARTLAFLVALFGACFFLVLLALGIFRVVLGGSSASLLVLSLYCLLAAVVNYLAWREIPSLEALAAQQRYGILKDRLIVWVVLGLVFFGVVGIVLAIAWVGIDPAPGSGVAAPPSSPPVCLRCGERASLIPEYNRYYCYRCSAYLW